MLRGTTLTPRLADIRRSPAATMLTPASEVAPAADGAPFTPAIRRSTGS